MINTDQIDTLLSHLFLQSTTPPPPPSPPPPPQNPHPTQPEPLKCLANLPEKPTKDDLGHFFRPAFAKVQILVRDENVVGWLEKSNVVPHDGGSRSMIVKGTLNQLRMLTTLPKTIKGMDAQVNPETSVMLKIFIDNERNRSAKYELEIYSCLISSFHSHFFAYPLLVLNKEANYLKPIWQNDEVAAVTALKKCFGNDMAKHGWETKMGIIVMEDCGSTSLHDFLVADAKMKNGDRGNLEMFHSLSKKSLERYMLHKNPDNAVCNKREDLKAQIKGYEDRLNCRAHVILQMISALRFMAEKNIVHNDLHFQNVKVMRGKFLFNLDTGLVSKEVGDNTIEMNHMVKIFDWDHAYSREMPEDDDITERKQNDKSHYQMYEHTDGNKIYDQLAFLKGIIKYKGDWAENDAFMKTLRTDFGWVLQPHQTSAFNKKEGRHYYKEYPQSTCDAINMDADGTYRPKVVPRENAYPKEISAEPWMKVTCRKKWENRDKIEKLVRFAIGSLERDVKEGMVK
jgi:hypothetical protein